MTVYTDGVHLVAVPWKTYADSRKGGWGPRASHVWEATP